VGTAVTSPATPLPGELLDRHEGRWLIADHGSQVLAWEPLDGDRRQVLWYDSADPQELPGVIRGGVPICAPWFGHGPDDDQDPQHGLARLSAFGREVLLNGPRFLLVRHTVGPEELGAPFRLVHTVEMTGGSMTLNLEATCTDTVPRRFEAVWHSYFRVGDAARATVTGVEGAAWHNHATGDAGALASDSLPIAPDTDTVLQGSQEALSVVDPAWGRRIDVDTQGCPTAVVWNPRMRSGTRTDLTGRSWRDFVCLETGTAKENALVLEPGQDTSLEMRDSVSTL